MAARTLLKRTTWANVLTIFRPRSTRPQWLFAISRTKSSSKMSRLIMLVLRPRFRGVPCGIVISGGCRDLQQFVPVFDETAARRERPVQSAAVAMRHERAIHARDARGMRIFGGIAHHQ